MSGTSPVKIEAEHFCIEDHLREIARLRAENLRLRAALRKAMAALRQPTLDEIKRDLLAMRRVTNLAENSSK